MISKTNNLILNSNNRYRNNPFYRQNKRTVKLPGFPRPKIEYNDLSEVENENPINRKNKKLENIDESSNSSQSTGKNKKEEMLNKEIQDNISELETNHKYKTKRQNRKRSSLMNSITTETFSRHPITINKYYITNNSPDDFYDPLDKNKLKLRNNNYNKNKNGERTVTIRRKKIKNIIKIRNKYII